MTASVRGGDENGLCNSVFDLMPSEDIIIDSDHIAKWESAGGIFLDPLKMNCGQCTKCHRWTTDRKKAEPVAGLSDGASTDGCLLCDECLPERHRWVF